jgi:hypothetical protein
MIAGTLGFIIRNLPAVLLIVALPIAAWRTQPKSLPERLLAWILLLPIGLTGLSYGIYHIFLPATSAAYIGWADNPFQLEVGMADLAIGITACAAFWRDLSFKAAAVCAASVFLLGDAVGHIRQMIAANNFAPGNAGVPFYMDVICPVLAIALLLISTHSRGTVILHDGARIA